MDFIKLFEPITINGLKIPNRIVMPSMGLAFTQDYSFNDTFKHFYRERARGGVGLMTIGPIAIDEAGSVPIMPALFDDKQMEAFQAFNQELHQDTETKLSIQLMHMGRNAFSFTDEPVIAPSPIPGKLTRQIPREMTKEDIEQVKNAFASAARRAKDAGFDFVEIIGCTGYLISQFLSPLTNQRNDEYGGSLENRMRFGLEVIRQVRKAVGESLPIGIRIAGNDFMDGGHTNVEASQFAAEAEKAGVDAINVTGGWHETYIPQLTTIVPPGAFVYLAHGIKKKVGIPVFASNRLGNPVVAEKALRSGACDMVCWGRPLIADPELPNKVKNGRLDNITPCVACNQGCFDAIVSGNPVSCVLNPRAGREHEFKIEKVQTPKKIMVAGGGPAGMEFALTAAQRGHHISLYEKEDCLGGQINLAKASPGKNELGSIINSMQNRMDLYGVDIHLNTSLTAQMVKEKTPDVLVVASGAKPIEINVPGINKPHVFDAWDVLTEKVWDIGKQVVIIGGSATGCETAHFITAMDTPDAETYTFLMYHSAEDPKFTKALLHESERKVTVVDLLPKMAGNVGKTSRWTLLKSLKLEGVALKPSTQLMEITDDAVIVKTETGQESIPADTVILAVGAVSVNDLTPEIKGKGINIITLGDAKEPRKINDAVREGFETAMSV